MRNSKNGPPNSDRPEPIREKLEQALKKAMEDQNFKTAIKIFSLVEQYKPGDELYVELMKVYEENKNIILKPSIIQK
jgi:tripartite-type tricarboxylate transporter receptor subunit TctC